MKTVTVDPSARTEGLLAAARVARENARECECEAKRWASVAEGLEQQAAKHCPPTHLPSVLASRFGISTSEARRAIAQGGVQINDQAVSDIDFWGPIHSIRLGMRRRWPAD